MSTNKAKKISGSPAENQSRVSGSKSRPKRVPISGDRDVLTVIGKDKDYEYRWVRDTSETGSRIFRFLQAAYEFVDATKGTHGIGDSFVYETHDMGSLVRKPAGGGDYLYLMRIPKEFFEEDAKAKQNSILAQEKDIVRERDPHSNSDDGQYGKVLLN